MKIYIWTGKASSHRWRSKILKHLWQKRGALNSKKTKKKFFECDRNKKGTRHIRHLHHNALIIVPSYLFVFERWLFAILPSLKKCRSFSIWVEKPFEGRTACADDEIKTFAKRPVLFQPRVNGLRSDCAEARY